MEVSIAERGSHLARADAEASVEALFADCDARRQQLGRQTWQGQPEGGTAEAPWAEVSAEPPKKQFKEAAKAARIQQNNAKERKKLDKLLLGDPESKDQATKDGLQQTVVNARPLARVLRGLPDPWTACSSRCSACSTRRLQIARTTCKPLLPLAAPCAHVLLTLAGWLFCAVRLRSTRMTTSSGSSTP